MKQKIKTEYQMGVSEMSDKIKELEKRIEALEAHKTTITIIDQRPIPTQHFPIWTCNVQYKTSTRPPCPIHPNGLMYPYAIC